MAATNVSSSNHSIVLISPFERLKINILSVLWGLWILFKEIIKSLLGQCSGTSPNEHRRKAPDCLSNKYGQHLYVKIQNTKFHYVERGPRDKPVVLLLHGFPDCWISWRHQVPALAKHFRVISLDLKGFGESDKPWSRRNYRIDVLLAELRALLQSLGVERCIVVGHDLGALLGWLLVHTTPQHVDKFVAISCPHPNLYWDRLPACSWFNSSWVHFSQLPYLPERGALSKDISIIDKCYPHLATKNLQESDYLDAYKYYFSRTEDWTGAINYYRNLPFYRVAGCEEGSVKVPCLLILGQQDSNLRLESVVRSTEWLAQHQVKIIDSAGHFPHQEKPDDVNNLLISFLVTKPATPVMVKEPSSGLFHMMYGAVSSTVKFGNHVLQKTAKSVSPRALVTTS